MRFSSILKSWRVFGSSLLADLHSGIGITGPMHGILTTVTYGVAPQIDASLGDHFQVTVTDAVAFAIAAPTNTPPTGKAQLITLTIRNTSGGAHGAGTFNAIFKTSGAVPAIANGSSRTFAFRWNGTNWVEVFRTAADVAN